VLDCGRPQFDRGGLAQSLGPALGQAKLGGFTGGDGLLVRPVEPHVEFEVAGVGGGLGAHRFDEPFDGA
jgi:hypothetical protein